MKFKDRKEERHVLETMDALVTSLKPFLNEETKERVEIAMRILHDARIEDEVIDNDIVSREVIRAEFKSFINQDEYYHPYSRTIPKDAIDPIINAVPGVRRVN